MYDKALIIQGFVVSGVWFRIAELSQSFPHLFGYFRNSPSEIIRNHLLKAPA